MTLTLDGATGRFMSTIGRARPITGRHRATGRHRGTDRLRDTGRLQDTGHLLVAGLPGLAAHPAADRRGTDHLAQRPARRPGQRGDD